ncbi:hypothetical protein CY34DRAFT_15557 [Suillus luteus UH-Slu-Lm8-n1]|uniref:Uncharacterized protein n=1 Tax=Suillus luteus UH-Slu-Lm8-n1 TaxID=930992 RepID=A0A0C9ZJM7_9AGAM|nr:hypothetical protein CY34DRAFT_15557 [Suillus luteus UH-Slu-Lm8-n1]
MKDKEPTSHKSHSQTSRPYPSTPCPHSQPQHSGPQFFPLDVLQDDDDMEHSTPILLDSPTSKTSVSPPNTPTPTPRVTQGRTPSANTAQADNITTPIPNPTPAPTPDHITAHQSDLTDSIHAPHNSEDQDMSAPPIPNANHVHNSEEEAILAHLALAETNRSILRHDSPNHCTTLPQFTPMPLGGFPSTHMSHSAQIFDHLDNRVLLTWFQVEHPKFKFMVRIFDHIGKNVFENSTIIAERVRTNIAIIANFVHQGAAPIRVSPPQPQGGRDSKDFPVGFLVHNISEETRNTILTQCIWSAADITLEAFPFSCNRPPTLLFCLAGFTTSNADIVKQTVADTWAYHENCAHINDIFLETTRDLIRSIHVEHLDFKITGGLSVPCSNIFAISPSNNAKTWMNSAVSSTYLTTQPVLTDVELLSLFPHALSVIL